MEQNKQQEKKSPIVIDNTNVVLGFLEKGMKLFKEYGITRVLSSSLLIAVISIFFFFVFNPNKVFEFYDEWKTRQHDRLMELRMDNTPKIQSLVDKLTYKVDASRVIVLELHNGNTGSGGFPFTKCSATFEGLNIGVHPVSDQYQNTNLSLMPFASYIFDNGYWCGNTDDIVNIDKGLYYKMKSNKTEHFAACVIEGIDKPLAFLFVSFDALPDDHDCNLVRENIRHVAMELAILMEVEKQLSGKI
jgi:hypothetical protein